jgi:hypothetical protein
MAVASLLDLGADVEKLKKAIASLEFVEGPLELVIEEKQNITITLILTLILTLTITPTITPTITLTITITPILMITITSIMARIEVCQKSDC